VYSCVAPLLEYYNSQYSVLQVDPAMVTELLITGSMIKVCARTFRFRKAVWLFSHDMWKEFLRQEDVANILYSFGFSR
jgi:hypothetical protein